MYESDSSRAFHLLVASFVGSMLALILSPNLITLIIGWDGLGISSFFLVIFYKSNKSFNAGLLTALSNRVGDALILISLSLGLFYSTFSTLPLSNSEAVAPLLLARRLAVAASTKSAQVPFRAWLPAAIAAPTPVSALVHSSTLVTAGVYLLLRIVPLLSLQFPIVVLGVLGRMTITIARLRAFLESDLKKIVALSTLSQLGVIVLSLRLGLAAMAFFHLIVHAFFKALLFIATGNLIHSRRDYQDLRRMGGHLPSLPITQATVIITKLRLCGLPFFSAFYSKELVLESLSSQLGGVFMVYVRIWAGVLCTAIYSLRFITYVLNSRRGSVLIWKSDYDFSGIRAIIILYFPSFFTGKFLLYHIVDTLSLPLRSESAKLLVLALLLIFAPLLVISLGFTASKRKTKSLFYLWLLSRWRGIFPLKIASGQSYALRWLARFGWTDRILGTWFLSLAFYLSPIGRQPAHSYFKFLLRVFVLLALWRVF